MKRHRRVTIPRSALKLLPESTNRSPIQVRISVNGTSRTGSLAFLSPSGTDDDRVLYFHKAIAGEIAKRSVGQPLLLMPVYSDEDPMILDSIDIFTDVSQIPSEDRDETAPESLSNNLFLAVRPDWRDSTSLLGYFNPLTKTYEWTEFLHFLIRARNSYEANDGLAWFVILDEMNLAHVEYYFADLLSIIESGRDERGYSREPLRFSYPDAVENTPPPAELHLPPNLYIIGTVNMDETTHAFSPKVLDRAFTIELTDVDFKDYPPHPADAGEPMSDDDKHALLRAFTRAGTFAQISKDDIRAIVEEHGEIRTWLANLNTELEKHRFHFGYRVFDEIAQFVFNADDNGMFPRWRDAFEHAVYMKVLPKFNGSRARLHRPLLALVAWAIEPNQPDVDYVESQFNQTPRTGTGEFSTLTDGATFPSIAERGVQMLQALEEDGFVSFG